MASGLTSAATLSRAFGGDYLSMFVDVPTVPVALAFIAVVALVNFRGIAESVRLNLVLTSIELTGLLLVVVIGLATVSGGEGGVDAGRVLDFKEGGVARRRNLRWSGAGFLRFDRVRGFGKPGRGGSQP
jgi:basic amino acid/polyamine antiporter, APA family